MVKGTGGETDERRKIEFEVASYYTLHFTPKDEFKHLFFEDWNKEEWLEFDNFMLSNVLLYMKSGIIPPPQINLKENKLILSTSLDFITFIDNSIESGLTYDKGLLIELFKNLCPAQKYLSAITFKKWIDKWAESRDYFVKHFKSDGKALLIVDM